MQSVKAFFLPETDDVFSSEIVVSFNFMHPHSIFCNAMQWQLHQHETITGQDVLTSSFNIIPSLYTVTRHLFLLSTQLIRVSKNLFNYASRLLLELRVRGIEQNRYFIRD